MQQILSQLPALLLGWYDRSARVLPWREEPMPYRVWVSEIMLQQTRVEAVLPYYERFLAALPTIEALAEAPEDRLLKLWEGLGYYNRARNMQRAARMVMERHGGRMPGDFEALRALPGIGDYTAGAIASIAFQLPVPAVDGNVLRVLSRVLCSREDILDSKTKRRTEENLRAVLPERVGDFNQSLMELGALICLPNGRPKCEDCPLAQLCEAHRQGLEEELPVKAAKTPRKLEERTLFLLTCGGRMALQRRPERGLLAGLWELPAAEGRLSREEAAAHLKSLGLAAGALTPLSCARHVFTHLEWHMTAWAAETAHMDERYAWVTGEELKSAYPLPSAFKAYFPEIEKRLSE